MKIFAAYLRERRQLLITWALSTAVFALVVLLYGLPAEGALYGAFLSALVAAGVLGAGSPDRRRRLNAAEQAAADPARDHISLPAPAAGPHSLEGAYRRAILAQTDRCAALRRDRRELQDDLLDYFATWAHQVKTPLAAMRLLLQSGAVPAELEPELFRTEGYVDAAMGYLRLGAESRDLVLAPTALDPLVRGCLRRYARMFILGRLRLDYAGAAADARPVTDGKWTAFILEQLLSNAVKYTPPGGTVTVTADSKALTVADTGPGIDTADLPRIFEKGYTGANGRQKQAESSGLGLYLCARAAGRMGCTLKAENRPEGGCVFTLTFPEEGALYE